MLFSAPTCRPAPADGPTVVQAASEPGHLEGLGVVSDLRLGHETLPEELAFLDHPEEVHRPFRGIFGEAAQILDVPVSPLQRNTSKLRRASFSRIASAWPGRRLTLI